MARKVWKDLSQLGITRGGKDNMFEEAIMDMENRDFEGMKDKREIKSMLK